jgi:RNA polymerase sigma factor (sigma-70 family)
MDLAEIVDRLREGQRDVVPLFVSVLAPTLYRYAAVVAGDLGDVDRDLVCERALERAAAKIDRYDPDVGPISRWVLPFVRHAAEDVRRGAPGAPLPLDNVADVPYVAATRSIDTTTADELLATLAMHDRLLLELRYTEQLTFGEIANALGEGITEAAVRQRHARLLRALRTVADGLLEETSR